MKQAMNGAHLHLMLNHLPVILPLAGMGILLGGLIWRSGIVKRTAYILFIVSALFTVSASVSGEEAEEIAEKIPGVEHAFIEAHEEAAETFAIFSYALGAFSLLGFWASYSRQPFEGLLAWLALLICASALYFGLCTARTGGEIRHTEIRA